MNKQFEHLTNIEKISPSPFKICRNRLQETKWVPHYKVPLNEKNTPCDHRTVLSNEVIFELDARAWGQNKKIALIILGALEELEIPYYMYATGGKGVHISIYFNKLVLTKEQTETFNTALRYGFTWKHIRLWLLYDIISYAGLSASTAGKGAGFIIDTAPISFNELYDGTHLIRSCGGRHQVYNKEAMDTETHYKTFITKDDLKSRKPRVTNLEHVNYPSELETFDINTELLFNYIESFINKAIENKQQKYDDIKLDGGFMGLACIQTLLDGTSEGQRSMGAQMISSALILDDTPKPLEILKDYTNNCKQTGDSFTLSEATNWYTWLQNQPSNFFNHKIMEEMGWCDGTCEYTKILKKDAIKVLENSKLLERINKYIGITVAGEEKTRVLLFLLLLSSKFDVKGKNKGIGSCSPQSIILSSSSSSGKSWVTKQILKLFGEDSQVYSRMTASVLNYFQDVDMTGKILFIEELQSLDSSSNQLRLWISEGTLKLASVEKEKDDDGVETNKLTVKKNIGQPAFITGTAEDEIDEQMSNRSWLISMDITTSQNAKVLDFADKVAKGLIVDDFIEQRILQDAIKELKSYEVIIPFLDRHILNLPIEDTRVRRDYNKLKTLICCSALLHQYQREIITTDTGKQLLIAEFDDYEIARYYSMEILESSFVGLTNQQMEILNIIRDSAWSLNFTASHIQVKTGYSQKKCYTILKQLEEVGAIIVDGTREIGKTTTFMINTAKRFGSLELPNKDDFIEKLTSENTIIDGQPIPKPRLFSEENDENSQIYDFEIARKLWQKLGENENNSRRKILGSPKKIIIKALETGNTDHLPPQFQFVITYSKNLFQKVYILFAKRKSDSASVYKTDDKPEKLGEMTRFTKEDIIKIFNESNEHLIDLVTLTDMGIPEVLINNMKADGDLYEAKPGRFMLL